MEYSPKVSTSINVQDLISFKDKLKRGGELLSQSEEMKKELREIKKISDTVLRSSPRASRGIIDAIKIDLFTRPQMEQSEIDDRIGTMPYLPKDTEMAYRQEIDERRPALRKGKRSTNKF